MNPGDTNNADQDAVAQNPSQNTANQSATFLDQNAAEQNTAIPVRDTTEQNAASPDQNLQPGQPAQSIQLAQPDQSAQLVQPIQPVQDSLVQNVSLATSSAKTKLKKPILIAGTIGALVLAIAAIAIVCFVVRRDDNNPAGDAIGSVTGGSGEGAAGGAGSDDGSNNGSDDNSGDGPDVGSDVASVMDVEKFTQMTKAEAITFLQAGRNTAGNIPKNYIGEEITDLVIVKTALFMAT